MGSKARSAARAAARKRIAAEREAERRRERIRRIVLFVAAGAGVAILGVVLIWVGASSNKAAALPKPVAANGAALPPWPVPADSVSRAQTAGLTAGAMEGTAKHIHAHLDIIVNGRPVQVPQQLGIDSTGFSELHTHDTTGVIHVESPTANKRFILGEVFDEWNVKLDATDLGGLKADAAHPLTAYVDGKKWAGNPAAIELTAHREIALVYGQPGGKIPSSYVFAQGL